ncbi:MAG: dihydrolipoyl dehydrogenase [Ignavibacteriales bacterium]|nr:dihydrolipoyl dehydrogenase [Ignavibacteriales bacterium]
MAQHYDLAVLGGGPGGYVAAIRAGQLGLKTVVIDKDNLGGVCLNWGCIPTKALLKSAEMYESLTKRSGEFGLTFDNPGFDFEKIIGRSRDVSSRITKNVEMLVKKNKVDRVRGTGRFVGKNKLAVTDENGAPLEEIEATNVIVATGARPRTIDAVPVDREVIVTSKEAMTLPKLPERFVVVGAGAIGVEFAYFYAALGSKVTIVEMMDRILPVEDEESSAAVAKSFKKNLGVEILTSAKVERATASDGEATVELEHKGEKKTLEADVVLNAIGVVGNVEDIGLEEIGVEVERGAIKVDKATYRTNVENVYAVGDVIGPPWLAHVASHEAIACVEGIKGLDHAPVDYGNIPGCTYCQPQVASVGLTEAKAKEAGYELKIGKFPFMASGKAFALGDREGHVKLIFDKKYGELLGAHIVGAEATELIAELGVAKTLETDDTALLKTVHAHPTLSEAIMEAAAQANGEAIHM